MHIDWWTLALQTVNVLVLIWILGRFFFRPVADIIAKRQQQTSALLAEADAARHEAADLRAAQEKARANIGADRDRLIAEARKAAEAEKTEILAQASAENDKLRGETKKAIARERAAADDAITSHASELSIDISRRLLSRLPPDLTFAAFLEGACRELRALAPDEQSRLLASTTGDSTVEVVTAEPLSDSQTQEVRNALASVLGMEAALSFKSDPALIAGIEFHGRNTVVRNSWQADLERIGKELGRDGNRGGP